MVPPFDIISKIYQQREVWRLKVRVIRLWVIPNFSNHEVPGSIEMVLMDKATSAYKFFFIFFCFPFS